MLSANAIERRLQLSGIILILGLLVEGSSLVGRGPVAFLVFVGLGGLLLFVGMLTFLLTIVHTERTQL
jgi:hypothetical protein